MNHSSKYRLIQEGTGKRVPKTNLQPYGVYKISTYKYADGNKERLSGSEETIIFVTGIYERKVSALKLSNIPPANFFKWFKKLIKTDDVVKDLLELDNTALYDLGEVFDKGGNRVYDGYIKNNRNFVAKGAAYRTYNLDGIQYSTEIFFKQDTLNKYYG
tara:strand:- start:247 stop:723 length:477 start_codon:yes stop_codon:yes gene_type:complete